MTWHRRFLEWKEDTMKKSIAVIALSFLTFLTFCVAFSGCGQRKFAPGLSKTKKVAITDSLGRSVEVPCPPARIVCLNSDVSEVICALGAGDRIVGVTNTDDFPPAMKDKPKVGEAFTPSVEKVLELRPDVVFGYGKFLKAELAQKIEKAGVPLVYIDCYKLNTLAKDIKTLGTILGKEREADEYVAFCDEYLSYIRSKVEKLKPEERPLVYLEGYGDYSTVSRGSGGAPMVEAAGGLNVADSEPVPYPKVNPEWVVAKNPQVIIKASGGFMGFPVGYGQSDEGLRRLRDEICSRPGWEKTRAVKDDRVYVLSAEIYTGPRIVVGIAYFAKWLHPELFADLNPSGIHEEFLKKFHHLKLEGSWVYPEI